MPTGVTLPLTMSQRKRPSRSGLSEDEDDAIDAHSPKRMRKNRPSVLSNRDEAATSPDEDDGAQTPPADDEEPAEEEDEEITDEDEEDEIDSALKRSYAEPMRVKAQRSPAL